MDARRSTRGPPVVSIARASPVAGVPGDVGFVGRAAEISELASEIGAMLAGRPRVRLIVGEAGIGKTRIAEQIARLAERDGIHALWGRSHDDAGEPPFWPWAQAIRGYVARRSDDELRADIAAAPAVAEIVPVVRERLPDLPSAPAPSSEQARFALFAGFAAFLVAASVREPILVVLDDVHWADDATLRLLRFVAREPVSARLLVLATLREAEARRRPEIQQSLADLDRLAPRVTLGGLGEGEVLRLAEASLGRSAERGLASRVRELTGGNPFFVAEVLRALSRAGEVSASTLNELAVPEGARAAVRGRLKLLTPAARRLLEVAAVVGETFDVDVLPRAAKLPRARVVELLEEARADSLVVGRSERSSLWFVHALVREVLYDELPVAERGRLHFAVARAIEETWTADLDSHAASLVRHYEVAAGSSGSRAAARAVDCAMRAAEQASARGAFEDAAAYLTRALSLLADANRRDEVRAEILVRLGEARACGGDKAAARTAFAAAAELARQSGLWTHLARAALGFAGMWARIVVRADPEVLAVLEEALAAAPPAAEASLRSRLQARLAVEMASPALASRRLALADQSVADARRARDDDALAFALTVRHLLFGEPEDLERRLGAAREVVEIARRKRSDEGIADGLGFLVHGYLEAGRIAELDDALLEQTRLSARLRQPEALWYVAVRRVMRALLAGRLAEAEALSEESAQLTEKGTLTTRALVFGLQRAMIRREQGRLGEVEDELRAFVVGARDLPQAPFLLAWLHASLGRQDEAAAALERIASDRFARAPSGIHRLPAFALAAEAASFLGDRQRAATLRELLLPYAGRQVVLGNAVAYFDCVSRSLGLVAMALGDVAEAEQHFEAALATYRRLGAAARAAHAEVDLAQALLASGDEARRRRALELLAEAGRTASEIGMPGLERCIFERAKAAGQAAPVGAAEVTLATYVFRRDGEYWSINYPGSATMRFRDARGMRQIAFLLARPGEEVSVFDLVSSGDRKNGARPRPDAVAREDEVRSHLGDAGEVLDARSRQLYRDRIRELREQAEEARACNDILRASAAEHEIDALSAELQGAFGLRGTPRHVASHAERARVSATRTVRDAIRRIAEQHPQLGYHLEHTIKTGRFCSYDPPPEARIPWQLR
jgi:tetratricopeptide (TPR) repeat protein